VAVTSEAREPHARRNDPGQQQQDLSAPAADTQTATDDATGRESDEREKPADGSVEEGRLENDRDETQPEQQQQQPETGRSSEEDKTQRDAERPSENEQLVSKTARDAAAAAAAEPVPPSCRLVMVLYGDHGQTEPLLLDYNDSISAVKFLPGIADKFIVSEYADVTIVLR